MSILLKVFGAPEHHYQIQMISNGLKILQNLQLVATKQRLTFQKVALVHSWRTPVAPTLKQHQPEVLLSLRTPSPSCQCTDQYSTTVSSTTAENIVQPKLGSETDYFDFASSASPNWKSKILSTMLVYPNFISQDEETNLMKEIEPYISRLHYETSHWDDAINDYRETERSKWNRTNTLTINRIRSIGFPPNVPQLKLVHILDLAQKGHIKPHIDSVRFCGNTIAGLSLLSDCVMRLRHDAEKDVYCDVFLPQWSLYVMSDIVRYEFTHEILGETDSKFKENAIARKRRISIVCRNEPPEDNSTAGPIFVPIPEN